MYIDLSDKVQSFLVQEYVNKICNFKSEEELDWNVHKLIHTFQVVQMAKELIKNTKGKMPLKIQKQIINAAVLHDLGRCYEFKFGQHLRLFDHGKKGKELILKKFPLLNVEAETVLYHNKLPSTKDPKNCFPVLDYVRDADMLANLEYTIQHFPIFIRHIFSGKKSLYSAKMLDSEIIQAVKERRSACTGKVKEKNILTSFLWQLCWVFNLRTQAGKDLSTRKKLFVSYKKIICKNLIPLLNVPAPIKKDLIQKINLLFPDSLFQL